MQVRVITQDQVIVPALNDDASKPQARSHHDRHHQSKQPSLRLETLFFDTMDNDASF
jgi:hypothetical protein